MTDMGAAGSAVQGGRVRWLFTDAGEVIVHMTPWPERLAAALRGLGLDERLTRIPEALARGEDWLAGHTPQDLLTTWWAEERHARGHLKVVARSLGLGARELGYLRETCYYTVASRPFPDASLALQSVRALGYRLGLISNAPPSLRALLVRWGLMPLFDHVTLSSDVGVLKPDPAIYQAALAGAGARADESVFIDDLVPNVEEARALGFRGAFVVDRAQAHLDRGDRLEDLRCLPTLLAPTAPLLRVMTVGDFSR